MFSYLFTVVLSAFLLFMVQPLIGKVILPWFGGSAGVWSSVLFFFQFVLLLGYTYSFIISAYVDRRKQIYVHSGVVALSFLMLLLGTLGAGLPLIPSAHLKPASGTSPIIRILIILGSSVGFPYFVLSTTGPLLQSWYAADMPDRTPYWLYALSNGGSFVALISYPFVIEPLLSVPTQAWLWSLAYFVFVLGVGLLVLRARHHMPLINDSSATTTKTVAEKGHPASGAVKQQVFSRRKRDKTRKSSGRSWKRRALSAEEHEFMQRLGTAAQWLLLSMCTAILLASVTNQITQDVAPIPLLWVLPLALYLLSFVICFSIKVSYTRISIPLLGIATLAIVYALARGNELNVLLQLGIYAISFFMACLACHGELTRLRPEPQLLTAYYLIIALGGVLGTAMVSLVAPLVFDHYWEFHLGYLLCWALLIGVLYLDRNSILHQKRRSIALYALLIPPVTLLLFTGQYKRTFEATTLASSRNFYGTLRLQEQSNLAGWDPFYVLSHGATIHGMQFKPSDLRKVPISYFTISSGVGRLLTAINADPQGKRVGILGLGVGTLAAYGREQDVYRFYEINPEVVDLAEGREGYFNYLSNALADIDVVLGDARLSLERELTMGKGQAYDVLILDVFSGDFVPVHLLTEECFALYLSHLSSTGVIAANVSTTHINLTPLLALVSERYNLNAILIEDDAVDYPCCSSRWVLMSRTTEILSLPSVAEFSRPLDEPTANQRLWTDDYSTPFQVLY